jgi:hypothetical protein
MSKWVPINVHRTLQINSPRVLKQDSKAKTALPCLFWPPLESHMPWFSHILLVTQTNPAQCARDYTGFENWRWGSLRSTLKASYHILSLCYFWGQISLCSPGWPQTPCAQVILLASPSQVAGIIDMLPCIWLTIFLNNFYFQMYRFPFYICLKSDLYMFIF